MTATAFAVMGVVALVWGGAHVGASVLLRRRHPAGRVLTLGLAVVNLLVLPFGTALGAYALWILLTDEGRRLFEPVDRQCNADRRRKAYLRTTCGGPSSVAAFSCQLR